MSRALLLAAALWAGVAHAAGDRVVSVGAALTEILFALDHGDRVVGVDSSSLCPASAQTLPRVGSHRQVHAESILALSPDTLFVSDGVGPGAALDQLRAGGLDVHVVASPTSLAGARDRILEVGRSVGAEAQALELVTDWPTVPSTPSGPKVAFLYARGAGTMMLAGHGTGIDEVVEAAGGQLVGDWDGFRPVFAEALVSMAPDVLLMTTRGLESMGGAEGLKAVPGLSLTPAGRNQAVLHLDDVLLLSLGPRTPQAIDTLRVQLQELSQ